MSAPFNRVGTPRGVSTPHGDSPDDNPINSAAQVASAAMMLAIGMYGEMMEQVEAHMPIPPEQHSAAKAQVAHAIEKIRELAEVVRTESAGLDVHFAGYADTWLQCVACEGVA